MPNQVKASHILVQSINLANDLLVRISGGESFAALASEHSECPSGKNGGDLGFFRRGQMVKPFEDAAFSANKGQVVGPIKTQFGYHLIKVTDTR
jgi:peptidyl-prolyl cis-trans isomerase C